MSRSRPGRSSGDHPTSTKAHTSRMGAQTPHREIHLSVPGEDRFLEMLRGLVGRAARLAGFSFAGIEDFTLAVDEAAVLLLETRPSALHLDLRGVEPGASGLEALVSVTEPSESWPPSGFEEDSRWQVLSALSDTVRFLDPPTVGIGLTQKVR